MATWAKPAGGGLMDAQAVQTNAETDPSSATEGMDATSVAGFTFTATCDVGQTFNSGATTFEAWEYHSETGLWSRAESTYDVTVGTGGTGKRSISATFSVANPRGRRIHVWDGTGVTGGNVTTTYTASLLSGRKDYP